MARGTDNPVCLTPSRSPPLAPECQYVSKKMAKDYLFGQGVDVVLESPQVAAIAVVCLRAA